MAELPTATPVACTALDLTDPNVRLQWDSFISEHPDSSYGHRSAILMLAERLGHKGRSVGAFIGEQLVGLLPLNEVQSRRLRVLPTRRFVSGAVFPAGPLVLPALAPKMRDHVLTALINEASVTASRHRAVDLDIAYPSSIAGRPASSIHRINPLKKFGFTERSQVSLLLDLSQGLDVLLSNCSKSCRQRISQAHREGIRIRVAHDREDWLACYPLAIATMGPLAPSRTALAHTWDMCLTSEHSSVLIAEKNGEVVGTSVMYGDQRAAFYWHGFYSRASGLAGLSNALVWELITIATRRNLQVFELGSMEFINAKQVGISRFKESFGGSPHYTVAATRPIRPVLLATLELLQALSNQRRNPRATSKPAAAEEG